MSRIGFTNNAALCVAKWFTSTLGMGLDWTMLDEPSVIAAANICDERVLVGPGSTTVSVNVTTNVLTLAGGRSLDWSDGVRFSTSGTLPGGISAGVTYYVIPTDYGIRLSTTAQGSFTESAVDITSAGSGTTTLTYYDEARYKIAGEYKLDVSKGEVLKQLLTAMAGVAVYIGGKWFIYAGAAAVPTITLTENDLRGDLTWQPKRPKRDRFNGVRAVHVNPDANWQPTDAPPMLNDVYVEEDGEELYADLRFPFTTSSRCVQRLSKIYLERNRQQGMLNFPAKLTGMKLQTWDGAYISIARYGWVQKQFRAVDWALAEEGGVDLILQEDSASVYSWSVDEEIDEAEQQGVVAPDPTSIAVPVLTVNTPQILIFTKLFVEWTGATGIWTDGFDLEHRAQGVTDWTSYGRVSVTAAKKAVIDRSTPTDFRIRTVNKSGASSAWSETLAPSAPTSVTADTDIGPPIVGFITWVNAPTCVTIQLYKNGVLHNSTISGPAQIAGELDDGSYQLRSVDVKGNISAPSAAVTITGVGSGDGGSDGSEGGEGGGEE